MTYEEIQSAEFWKPEQEGDQIEGELLRTEEGQYGKVFVLKTTEGEKSLPNLTALESRMLKVKIGQKIRATYIGEKTGEKSKRTYKDFKVEVDQ